MIVQNTTFEEFDPQGEGFVVYGFEGDSSYWIGYINEQVTGNSDNNELWKSAYVLTTPGGRTDLVLMLKDTNMDLTVPSLMAVQYKNCGWLSSFLNSCIGDYVTVH